MLCHIRMKTFLSFYHGTSVPVGKSITLIYPWSRHHETKSIHPYPSRASQQYQECGKRQHGLGDVNMTNKTNDLPSQIDLVVETDPVWIHCLLHIPCGNKTHTILQVQLQREQMEEVVLTLCTLHVHKVLPHNVCQILLKTSCRATSCFCMVTL